LSTGGSKELAFGLEAKDFSFEFNGEFKEFSEGFVEKLFSKWV
jgi:hypothetical protein